MRGIEPLTFSLPRKRSTPELHRLLVGLRRLFSSGRRGSNSRPTAWKAVALPTELLPQFGKNLHVLVGVSGLEPLNPKERIYSPPQLPLCDTPLFISFKRVTKSLVHALLPWATSRDRTNDLLITSQLLYQLSYGGLYVLERFLFFNLPSDSQKGLQK